MGWSSGWWRLSRPSPSLANRPERRGRKKRVMTTMSAKLKLSFENLLVEAEKRYRGAGGGGGIRATAARRGRPGGTREVDAFPI
jgi:hypothetical protein